MPRHRGGTFSIASEAPTPHSAPIPIPKSARRMKNAVKFGASPESTSTIEKKIRSIISGSRRP